MIYVGEQLCVIAGNSYIRFDVHKNLYPRDLEKMAILDSTLLELARSIVRLLFVICYQVIHDMICAGLQIANYLITK